MTCPGCDRPWYRHDDDLYFNLCHHCQQTQYEIQRGEHAEDEGDDGEDT